MEERLQKLIALAGVASRRKAEELIEAGQVTVNGEIVTTLGRKADPAQDHIKVKGKLINAKLEQQEKIYILLYKPLGFLTSKADPQGRQLVIDLLGKYRDKVHPVGRLDVNSEGLLLLTNDGQFTQAIAHAAGKVPKVYEVKVKGQPSEKLIEKLARGVVIDGRKTRPAEIKPMELSETNAWYQVTLYEGRNQQIRKMFDAIGHSVLKLRRVAIGFLQDAKLMPGSFRLLRDAEVKRFLAMRPTSTTQPAATKAGTKATTKAKAPTVNAPSARQAAKARPRKVAGGLANGPKARARKATSPRRTTRTR